VPCVGFWCAIAQDAKRQVESQQRQREEALEARRKAVERIRANREAAGIPVKLNANRASTSATAVRATR